MASRTTRLRARAPALPARALASTLAAMALAHSALAVDSEAPGPPGGDAVAGSESGPAPGGSLRLLNTGVEGLLFLAAGGVWYLVNLEDNKEDWEKDPDSDRWYRKLFDPDEYCLDANDMSLNTMHVAAGAIYYELARGNGHGVLASLGISTGLSVLWEYLFEMRENVSVNDAIVTPFGGMAVGEAFYQLGSWFGSRNNSVPDKIISGLLLAPRQGVDYLRGCVGLAAGDTPTFRGDARHRILYGAGACHVESSDSRREDLVSFGFDAGLVRMPGQDSPGHGWERFADGNAVRLRAEGSVGSGRMRRVDLWASAVVSGCYWRRLTRSESGGCDGWESFLGLGTAFDMTDEQRSDWTERMRTVHILGPVSSVRWSSRRSAISAGVGLYGDLAMVEPVSLSLHEAHIRTFKTKTPLEEEGYYHAFGYTITSEIVGTVDLLEVGVRVDYVDLDSIEGLDRFQDDIENDVDLDDRRLRSRFWVAVPAPWGRLTARLEHQQRWSEIGPFREDPTDTIITCMFERSY